MQVKTKIILSPSEAEEELNRFANTFLNKTDRETTQYVVTPNKVFKPIKIVSSPEFIKELRSHMTSVI